jgi:hypothetical protein
MGGGGWRLLSSTRQAYPDRAGGFGVLAQVSGSKLVCLSFGVPGFTVQQPQSPPNKKRHLHVEPLAAGGSSTTASFSVG